MGYLYHGPEWCTLPESIRERIKAAAMVAQNETSALGVVLSNETEMLCGIKSPANIWERFGDSREVFIYDFGSLQEIYFKEADQIFHLGFCGSNSANEMEKVEKALGLNVERRPANNHDEVKIKLGDELLEKLVNLGHSKIIAREDTSRYHYGFSGPYMVRK